MRKRYCKKKNAPSNWNVMAWPKLDETPQLIFLQLLDFLFANLKVIEKSQTLIYVLCQLTISHNTHLYGKPKQQIF